MLSGRQYVRLHDGEERTNDIQLSTFQSPDADAKPKDRDSYISLLSTRDGPASPPRAKYSRGWRFGVLACASGACTVFLINLVATIWTLVTHGVGVGGRQVLYQGSCEETRKLNLGVHLLINVLSTILLSSSNYCMQCLSAATRKDVDAAHARGVWLDIGVPSFRNLWRIRRKRAALWWLLGLSSLPLHLFYNSAVFSSIMQYDYSVYAVDKGFESSNNASTDPGELWLKERDSLQRLSPSECMSSYAQDIITSRGNVILVLDSTDGGGADHVFRYTFEDCESDSYQWICAQDGRNSCDCEWTNDFCVPTAPRCQNRLDDVRANSSGWMPGPSKFQVDHCWSQRLPEKCRLQFSLHLAVVVLVLNAAKAVFMCMTAFGATEPPILTVGDAIASFLELPEPRTEGMSLISKEDVVKAKGKSLAGLRGPRMFRKTRKRWFTAASKTRWILCITMQVKYLLAIGLCTFFLVFGTQAIKHTVSSSDASFNALIHLGIGAITPLTFISWDLPSEGPKGLVLNVLVANAAQPILSFLYFSYNGLFTSLFVAYEWDSFSRKKKGLRVSAGPVGSQRSTYFLQLPYRIALPLMGISGLLHWLVSQSIFLVNIQSPMFSNDDDAVEDQLTCGYSPMAIFCVIMVGVVMIILVLSVGMQRYRSGMPVASSCSWAIAAACHNYSVAFDGREDAMQRVRWGVTGTKVDGSLYCGFSSGESHAPENAVLYT